MNETFDRPLIAELRHELDALLGNWFWFVILGAGLVVLGIIALGSVVIASLAAAVVIGALLLVAGRGRGGRRILVPWLERVFLAPAFRSLVNRGRAPVLSRPGRSPGGIDAAGGVLSDGRRDLQDRHGRELPVRGMGLATGQRDH